MVRFRPILLLLTASVALDVTTADAKKHIRCKKPGVKPIFTPKSNYGEHTTIVWGGHRENGKKLCCQWGDHEKKRGGKTCRSISPNEKCLHPAPIPITFPPNKSASTIKGAHPSEGASHSSSKSFYSNGSYSPSISKSSGVTSSGPQNSPPVRPSSGSSGIHPSSLPPFSTDNISRASSSASHEPSASPSTTQAVSPTDLTPPLPSQTPTSASDTASVTPSSLGEPMKTSRSSSTVSMSPSSDSVSASSSKTESRISGNPESTSASLSTSKSAPPITSSSDLITVSLTETSSSSKSTSPTSLDASSTSSEPIINPTNEPSPTSIEDSSSTSIIGSPTASICVPSADLRNPRFDDPIDTNAWVLDYTDAYGTNEISDADPDVDSQPNAWRFSFNPMENSANAASGIFQQVILCPSTRYYTGFWGKKAVDDSSNCYSRLFIAASFDVLYAIGGMQGEKLRYHGAGHYSGYEAYFETPDLEGMYGDTTAWIYIDAACSGLSNEYQTDIWIDSVWLRPVEPEEPTITDTSPISTDSPAPTTSESTSPTPSIITDQAILDFSFESGESPSSHWITSEPDPVIVATSDGIRFDPSNAHSGSYVYTISFPFQESPTLLSHSISQPNIPVYPGWYYLNAWAKSEGSGNCNAEIWIEGQGFALGRRYYIDSTWKEVGDLRGTWYEVQEGVLEVGVKVRLDCNYDGEFTWFWDDVTATRGVPPWLLEPV